MARESTVKLVSKLKELEKEANDLKRTEKKLKESEERFRLLYKRVPLCYQSLDEDGRFIEVNKKWLDTITLFYMPNKGILLGLNSNNK